MLLVSRVAAAHRHVICPTAGDADNVKKAAGKAKSLGYDEPTLLQYLGRVEGGEAIK